MNFPGPNHNIFLSNKFIKFQHSIRTFQKWTFINVQKSIPDFQVGVKIVFFSLSWFKQYNNIFFIRVRPPSGPALTLFYLEVFKYVPEIYFIFVMECLVWSYFFHIL
jgi:hypothetical protein